MRQELPGLTAQVAAAAAGDPVPTAARFLGRVEVYERARPEYPAELKKWLRGFVTADDVVADLGAGTGIFTDLLRDLDARVVAVEPNHEMRARLAERFSDDPRVEVLPGTAEATGLPSRHVSLVAAAQAAHWFSPTAARAEFQRILASDGRVLLVWNDWREVDALFNRDYGQVVRDHLVPGNESVDTRIPDGKIGELLPQGFERRVFRNLVSMSVERLRMLALSASYLPGPSSPAAGALIGALDEIFARHQVSGEVVMEYRTVAYLGAPSVA